MSNEGSGSVAGSSGAAPASPSPASSPASPAPSSTPAGGDSSGDFGFMTEVFGDNATQGLATPPPADAQPAPQPAETPQPPPAPEPAQPAPPKPQEAPASPQPSSPPGAQPTTAAEPEKFDPADPISLARGLDDNREAAIEHLAKTVFKLEPKELEELEVDVAGTVPKLLAKAVVFAQTQFLTQLSRVVPLMIQRNNAIVKRNDENMGEFYSAWPSLDRAKHGAVVQELAVRFRQMFPTVTKEQMIEQLGPMVLASQGLPVTPIHRGSAAAPKQNGAAPRPGQARSVGFVPAAPGTVAQTTTVTEDPWAFMGPES